MAMIRWKNFEDTFIRFDRVNDLTTERWTDKQTDGHRITA